LHGSDRESGGIGSSNRIKLVLQNLMPTRLKLCTARGSQAGTHETRAATVWGYADTDFEAEKELLEAIDWESLIVDDNH